MSLGSSGPIEYLKASHENVVTQAGAPADCDAGDAVTGGGGVIGGPSESAGLNASVPTNTGGDGWLAQGKTTATSDPRRVDTYAICGTQALGWSSATLPLDAIAQANETRAFPEPCNPGETGYGGIAGAGGDVRIISSYPVDEGWFSFVHNRSTSATNATSWRACTAAYETKRRLSSSTTKVKGEQGGKAIAKCKGREAVLAGGLVTLAGNDPARHTWASATRPWDSKDRKKVPDDGWLAKIYNYNSDGKVKLAAFALCAPR